MTDEVFTQSEEMKQLFITEANENLQSLNLSLVQLEKELQNKELLNEIFRVVHTLKGMAATMGFEKITSFSHEMENLFDKLRKGELEVTSGMIDIFLKCSDMLQLLVEEVISGSEKGLELTSLIDELKKIAENTSISEPHEPEKKPAPSTLLSETPKESVSLHGPAPTKTTSVRINIEHLDILMDLIGELVIHKAGLVDIASKYKIPELSEAIKQFDHIMLDLQEEVLKTRLVPISFIFDRYTRMVRDLARKKEKEIDFEIVGADIEVDRMLLEEISPPLVHLLRNAVDHGIESPTEREKNGKPPTGSVKLTSKREKGYVEIEVMDDGKGISPDEIREVAVERNFINKEEAEKLTDNEALMLICKPGFSTAKEITDISGRGVGMDTVKSLVEKFNGKMEIDSEKGKGTTINIHLPLSLAIIRALLVKVKDEIYAIPLRDISEIVRVREDEIKTIEKKEVLLLRDEVIPLFRLKELYQGEPKERVIRGYAVVVEAGGKHLGLVVDSLIGQQEIVIKTLTGFMRKIKGFNGATILGDGRVVLIVDVEALV